MANPIGTFLHGLTDSSLARSISYTLKILFIKKNNVPWQFYVENVIQHWFQFVADFNYPKIASFLIMKWLQALNLDVYL
jgi:hypothetical protein